MKKTLLFLALSANMIHATPETLKQAVYRTAKEAVVVPAFALSAGYLLSSGGGQYSIFALLGLGLSYKMAQSLQADEKRNGCANSGRDNVFLSQMYFDRVNKQ